MMKTLVVYDSRFGHTKIIAEAICNALPGDVELRHAKDVELAGLKAYDLLVAGAPTHGAKPSEDMQSFLDRIKPPTLAGIGVAGFDTRMTNRLITLFGTAAPKITKALVQKGGTQAGPPGGFSVTGGEGPLKEGEVERAAQWAKELIS
jgi:flavodoxin